MTEHYYKVLPKKESTVIEMNKRLICASNSGVESAQRRHLCYLQKSL